VVGLLSGPSTGWKRQPIAMPFSIVEAMRKSLSSITIGTRGIIGTIRVVHMTKIPVRSSFRAAVILMGSAPAVRKRPCPGCESDFFFRSQHNAFSETQ
jgi:hypothetical protein